MVYMPLVADGLAVLMARQEAGPFSETDMLDAELLPQLLLATTVISPEVVVKSTVIEVIPCPDVMDAPEKTDQV